MKQMCLLFFLTSSIECTCSAWGSTFLVEHRGMNVDDAARVMLVYFVGIAVGRFLSGVLAARLNVWTVVRAGLFVMCAALVLLPVPDSAPVCALGFFLAGLGNGPMFPNFNYIAPKTFGEEVSQSVIGLQMSFAFTGVMLSLLLCSLAGQFAGMAVFPFFLLSFYALMVWTALRVGRLVKV